MQNRRNVIKGVAWATPAILATNTIPAYAASRPTGQVKSPIMFQTPNVNWNTSCNASQNPIKGFIDTMPCNSPVTDRYGTPNSDCNQDPNSSQGFWLEGQSGTAKISKIKVTYTFSAPVIFDGKTYPQGTMNKTGKYIWNSPDILMPGWMITAKSSTVITLEYENPNLIDISTSVPGSGFATGFFINFRIADCNNKSFTINTHRELTYSDKTVTNKVVSSDASYRIP